MAFIIQCENEFHDKPFRRLFLAHYVRQDRDSAYMEFNTVRHARKFNRKCDATRMIKTLKTYATSKGDVYTVIEVK